MDETYTLEQFKDILDLLKQHNSNYDKVSMISRLTVEQVKCIDVVINEKFNYTKAGRGRPEMEKYIVAIRHRDTTCGWDNDDERIKAARELHDSGEVEITQAYDGLNAIMYAIPRHTKIERDILGKLTEEIK